MNHLDAGPLPFDRTCEYRIRVLGEVSARWSERLEGMAISVDTSDANLPVSTLVGELSDQAALSGVLNTLYELHVSVLSVERLSAQ
jgi:hypothetical protein